MAKYNREFLVPYLQSVCALELAHRKLKRKHSSLQSKMREYSSGYNNPRPASPYFESVVTFWRIFTIMLGASVAIFGLVGLVTSFSHSGMPGMVIFCIFVIFALGVLILWGPIALMRESVEENKKKDARYVAEMREYNRINEVNREMKKRVPNVQGELKICEAEQKRVQQTLQQAYSANIIPSRYRDIYVAIYLYDWFSTSQADDLDAALSMYVLEEIKDRLDTIIRNQSEMILNQYMIMSNQQKSLEQQEARGRMMRSKLDQIAATNEERNAYLGMIEGNTRATAYFAAADYIRKI